MLVMVAKVFVFVVVLQNDACHMSSNYLLKGFPHSCSNSVVPQQARMPCLTYGGGSKSESESESEMGEVCGEVVDILIYCISTSVEC